MKLAAYLSLVLALAEGASAAQRPVPSHSSSSAAAGEAVHEVARVNGVALTSDRLAAALSTLIPQESFHRNVSPEKMATLRQRALATVIDEELAYQDGVRNHIVATPAELKEAWTQTVARYGGAAKFDISLRQAGVSRASVENEIHRRVIIEKNFKRSVMDRCGVTLQDAELFFAKNPDRFVEPEQLHVYAVTVGVDPSSGPEAWRAAKARATEARKALDAGSAFGDVARLFSTDPSREKGGDMGFVHRGSMANPFETIVQKLPLGKPSDVIESLYGYHIVLVSEVQPPRRKTFDQVSATLMKDLSSSRCDERKEAWLTALRNAATIQTAQSSE